MFGKWDEILEKEEKNNSCVREKALKPSESLDKHTSYQHLFKWLI